MSRLTRDGTAEPVSRDQILRHARGQGNIIFPVQLTTRRIGNLTRLIHTLLYAMTIHTYIHTFSAICDDHTDKGVTPVLGVIYSQGTWFVIPVFIGSHPFSVLVLCTCFCVVCLSLLCKVLPVDFEAPMR